MTHPGLRPDSRLDAALVRQYLSDDQWRSTTLRSILRDAAREAPDRVAVIEPSSGLAPEGQVRYSELDALADRLAGGLRALGVRRGDRVAVMLPNGVEFTGLIFAIAALGAVYSGIPVAYGGREVAAVLRRSRASVLVAARQWGGNDILGLVRSLRADLPDLRTVVIAGPPGGDGGDDAANGPLTADEMSMADLLAAPADSREDAQPGEIVHVGFTSGTTGLPKGVMNTHQTLEFVLRRWVEHVGLLDRPGPPVNLVASPVGHHTGFVWGVLLTAMLRGTTVHLGRWNAERAAEAIAAYGVTLMFGAPTFLVDLLAVARPADDRFRTLDMVVVAGAPVPRRLPAEASAALGCFVCPAWGMTEYAIGVSASPRLPSGGVPNDGLPISGCEVRVVSDAGAMMPAGQAGELQIRGPGLFLGYLDQPEANAGSFVDGWFRTGDQAIQHESGHIELIGRTKDVIIRGGENIPVSEVESLIFEHPDVADCAVVGVPDSRLGERVVAVLVVRAGAEAPAAAELGVVELGQFLRRRGLSRHYLPEIVRVAPALPRTPSGKVRKVELREWLAADAEASR